MTQITVGIRELKARLSHYLRRVKTGVTLTITERGKPVGRIVPVHSPVETRVQQLSQAGLIAWSGRRLEPMDSAAQVRGEKTVAAMLLEDRE